MTTSEPPTPSRLGQAAARRRAALCRLGLSGIALAAAGRSVHAASDPTPQPWPRQRPTPPLALPGLDGTAWRLQQARGQVLLINFWASWCEPCRDELPAFEQLARRHAGDGLRVVAVNHRETDAALHRFLQSHPTELPILRDRDGAAARDWAVRIFPTTVAIGRDGRPRFTVIGEADWAGDHARRWLEPVLRP